MPHQALRRTRRGTPHQALRRTRRGVPHQALGRTRRGQAKPCTLHPEERFSDPAPVTGWYSRAKGPVLTIDCGHVVASRLRIEALHSLPTSEPATDLSTPGPAQSPAAAHSRGPKGSVGGHPPWVGHGWPPRRARLFRVIEGLGEHTQGCASHAQGCAPPHQRASGRKPSSATVDVRRVREWEET